MQLSPNELLALAKTEGVCVAAGRSKQQIVDALLRLEYEDAAGTSHPKRGLCAVACVVVVAHHLSPLLLCVPVRRLLLNPPACLTSSWHVLHAVQGLHPTSMGLATW